ncbi:TPA: hypothetical protein ACX6QE_000729 [Photobacterium damselae]
MKYLSSMKKELDDNWLNEAKDTTKKGVDDITSAEARLLLKYSAYDDTIESHTTKPQSTNVSDIKEILKDFYENPPKKLGDLLTRRRHNHGLNECPFCGNPFSPNTLDHFVPKEEWPEYSIFPNNLVPQCKDCAPTKGKKYFCDSSHKSMFIHPIYNDLLSKVKFKIHIEFDDENKIPNFSLSITIPEGLPQEDKSKLSSHFKELNIKQRVSTFCFREYISWKTKLEQHRFDIRIALQQRINEMQASERYKDWKTSLYQAILDSDHLMNYLISLNPSVSEETVGNIQLETEELAI